MSGWPPLYSNLSFKVEPGQVALLTGLSGSGKSTLAKIMLGLYGTYEGFIRIDGRDIRSMTVNELRGVFGVVPQETVLFAGTILDNVMAGIPDVIENMADSYQTTVGNGSGLALLARCSSGRRFWCSMRPPVGWMMRLRSTWGQR